MIQRSLMRFVCGERRTRDLLRMTGMLSIRQLVIYRILTTGLAAVYRGKPETLSKWGERSDRQLKTTQRSFQFIFGEVREKLPEYLRTGDPMKLKN